LRLLNGVLDFSKIESGLMELDIEPFALRALLEETMGVVRTAAMEKALELRLDVSANCPDAWIGDAGKIRQILQNLLGNAVKFTPKGYVALRVKRSARWMKKRNCSSRGGHRHWRTARQAGGDL